MRLIILLAIIALLSGCATVRQPVPVRSSTVGPIVAADAYATIYLP